MYKNVAIIGSSGAIGSALVKLLVQRELAEAVFAFARREPSEKLPRVAYHSIGNTEAAIQEAAASIASDKPLDLVIVASGILHGEGFMPEKSMRELSAEKFAQAFAANTIFPALLAKHFIPKLDKSKRNIFAALSARVGSISDNHLGGWYAYRASKAALNMVIKNLAIEAARASKENIIVGLHPGTVDSSLSKPFQENVPTDKLFTPEQAAGHLLNVLESLRPENSGNCFAWDGQEISP
jgi:NAD(P)-dependent dehydrogenase (short-subunit alcohol dehydrogenase family)